MKRPSIADKSSLLEKKQHLQVQITKYERECATISLFDHDGVELESNDLLQFQEEDQGNTDSGGEWEDESHPEAVTIFLPSNLSPANRAIHRLEEMGKCEAMLQVGQINDALQ